MKKNFSIKKIFLFILFFEICAISLIVFMHYITEDLTKQLAKASETKNKMIETSYKVKHSSDFLTHFARLYAVTGEKRYRDNFYTVLAIRNGDVQRPQNYDDLYWSYKDPERSKLYPKGEKQSLESIMQSLPYTKEELNLIQISHKNSDDLVKIEEEAFNAIIGIFKDKNSNYSIIDKPNFQYATKLLYSKEYMEAKRNIMQPINTFIKNVQKRNEQIVSSLQKKIFLYDFILYAIILFYVLINIYFSILLHKRILRVLEYITFSLNNKQELTDDNSYNKIVHDDELGLMITSYEKVKKEAQMAAKAKAQFLANMSHEIRTPMNAILGMLYLVKKTELSNVQENYINKAQGSAESLLVIINDILDFSKIDAGKLEIDNTEFNFYDLISKVTSMLSIKTEEKGLELLVRYDHKIPEYLFSDPTRIEQILINIINNAIKFTSNGEIIITPKIITDGEDDFLIRVCVQDAGIGIPLEDQKKLFKDFSQADTSTTRKFGGTGLGLTISKKLSNLLGGDMWLESSELNKGSTFCFTFKAREASAVPLKKPISQEVFDNLEVLVVDDNEVSCSILEDILSPLNIKTTKAFSGEEALDLILEENKHIDIILMDYKMPGLNGLETFKRLKIALGENTPKTIIITAYSKDDVIHSISSEGIESFLLKPVHPSLLYDTILSALGKEKLFDSNKEKNKKEKNEVSIDSLTGTKLLLVEDNQLNQEFATILLTNNGIVVDVANDGLEAIEMIKSRKYEIILMDIQMPNMDGLEAARHIRKMEDKYFQDIPIIALSAHAMKSDVDKSLNAGMNNHITKPLDPNELFTLMLKYIEPKESLPINSEPTKNIKASTTTIKSYILDIEDGVKRIGGDKDSYLKILQMFHKNYQGYMEDVTKLIQNEELQEAQKKVHQIKGVAGNIGAKKLFNIVQEIDTILKDNISPSKSQLKSMIDLFKEVLLEINSIVPQENKPQKEFEQDKVVGFLEQIIKELENDNSNCENTIDEILSYLNNTDFDKTAKTIKEDIENIDYDEALNLALVLKENIEKDTHE